ncbi:MAG: phosphoribosylanthranilate isomerase [Pseudomonadota bacterium]
MTKTHIKFCGFTRQEDLAHACSIGIDAAGLVLVPKSARCVSLPQARALAAAMTPPVKSVLLFLNPTRSDVQEAVDAVDPDVLQFHGTESPEFCAAFGRPWVKALSESVAAQEMDRYGDACKLLIDSHLPGRLGGTGQTIDAASFPGDSGGSRWVLAGGLTPGNVNACVRSLRPWAVDVSSGIESEPGIKDPTKMTSFVEQVRRADEA